MKLAYNSGHLVEIHSLHIYNLNSGHQFCQIPQTIHTCPPVSVRIHRAFVVAFITCRFTALHGTALIICRVTDTNHVWMMELPFHTVMVYFSML